MENSLDRKSILIIILCNLCAAFLAVAVVMIVMYTRLEAQFQQEIETVRSQNSKLTDVLKIRAFELESLSSKYMNLTDDMNDTVAALRNSSMENARLSEKVKNLTSNQFKPMASCDGLRLDQLPVESRNETGGEIDLSLGHKRAYCDVTTDNGDWIVFQRRMDGSVNFYRNWTEFVKGFGTPRGEYWLGLEAIHQLTKSGDQELRKDMIDFGQIHYYAQYRTFTIAPACNYYRIQVDGYSGNATNALQKDGWGTIDGQQFSTYDADHDGYATGNCAELDGSGWWHKECSLANLNGFYGEKYEARGIKWQNLATDKVHGNEDKEEKLA